MPEPAGVSKSYSAIETQGLARANTWLRTGTAYALEQARNPSTIGFVLASSPIALLAWFVSASSYFSFSDMTSQDWRKASGHGPYRRVYPRVSVSVLVNGDISSFDLSLPTGMCIQSLCVESYTFPRSYLRKTMGIRFCISISLWDSPGFRRKLLRCLKNGLLQLETWCSSGSILRHAYSLYLASFTDYPREDITRHLKTHRFCSRT